jgi:basic amino acid/polyamine antiporter, APA family
MAFKKVLGFWDLLWLGVGGMVGVAILSFPAETYQMGGAASIISWVLAGVFSLFMAFIYCEMVTAFPTSGALVRFPYEAFGKTKLSRYLAFLEGTGYYIGTLFGIVISAIILGAYIVPQWSSGIGQIAIAEIALLIVGIINIFGVKLTSKVNLVMSIVFMILFAVVIVLALFHGSVSGLTPFLSGAGSLGIINAIPIAILAYGAWTALLTIPEEASNVRKIPKAVFWSIVIVTIFYALMVLAVYMNVSASTLNQSSDLYPVYIMVSLFNNPTLLAVFQIAAVLAIVAVMIVMVLSNARILFALTRMDFLPQSVNKMSSNAIPIYATLLSFLIPMGLSFFPNQYYQYIVIGAIVGTGLPRLIDLVSYLKIRNKANYKPLYRARWGVALAAIAFIGLVVSELSLGLSDVVYAVPALIVISALFVAIDRYRWGLWAAVISIILSLAPILLALPSLASAVLWTVSIVILVISAFATKRK